MPEDNREQRQNRFTKHGWDKKIIRRVIIRSVISGVALELQSLTRYYYIEKNHPELRYPYQATVIFLVISLFSLWLALRKLVPKSVKDEIKARFGRLVSRYIKEPFARVASKIRKLLGIPEGQRIRGKDEKSFIFDLENNALFRKLQNVKNQMRWRDLKTNSEKIRYLYVKYVIKLIKTGFRHSSAMTPAEIRGELKLADEPEKLFLLYEDARYAGEYADISDEDVEMSEKLIKKQGA